MKHAIRQQVNTENSVVTLLQQNHTTFTCLRTTSKRTGKAAPLKAIGRWREFTKQWNEDDMTGVQSRIISHPGVNLFRMAARRLGAILTGAKNEACLADAQIEVSVKPADEFASQVRVAILSNAG